MMTVCREAYTLLINSGGDILTFEKNIIREILVNEDALFNVTLNVGALRELSSFRKYVYQSRLTFDTY